MRMQGPDSFLGGMACPLWLRLDGKDAVEFRGVFSKGSRAAPHSRSTGRVQ